MVTTFEAFLQQQTTRPRRGRRLTYGLSLFLHAGALAAGLIGSCWRVDEVSPPEVQTLLLALPATPPPPGGGPEQSARPPVKSRPRPRPPQAVVAPLPEALVEERQEVSDQPDTTGADGRHPQAGGTGGVGVGPGGPGTEPGPGPAHFVAPTVARGQLAIDPHADPYRVELPQALGRTGMTVWALVQLCVTREGRVTSVKIIKGADPTVDPLITSTLRTWRYRPYAIDGRPVPFCTNLRYEITAR